MASSVGEKLIIKLLYHYIIIVIIIFIIIVIIIIIVSYLFCFLFSSFDLVHVEMSPYLMFILLFRVITGIISPNLPENAFINFSNLAIL